jgi:hypothetical protein
MLFEMMSINFYTADRNCHFKPTVIYKIVLATPSGKQESSLSIPWMPSYTGMTAVNNRYNNSTQIKEPGYLERTSVLYFVGAGCSRARVY